MKSILLKNLESKQFGNEIWPVHVILKKKIFCQKSFTKNMTWKLIPNLFSFSV